MSALAADVSKLRLGVCPDNFNKPTAGEYCHHTSSLISPVSKRLVVSATAVHASQLQAVLALAPEISQLLGSTAEGGRSFRSRSSYQSATGEQYQPCSYQSAATGEQCQP